LFQQPLPETIVNTKSSSSRRLGLYATTIVCAVASSLTAVCAAADSSDIPSAVVKFADLNLSNPEGVTALYRRINAAARDVCKGYDIRSGSYTHPGSADPCVRKAIQDAVNKVGHPALSAMYNAKHPQPVPITVASAKTR
jgi:UrcA family protein